MEKAIPYPGCSPYAAEEKARLLASIAASSRVHALIGLELLDIEPGYARVAMPVRPEFMNSGGAMQGGLVTTLADATIAYAIRGALPPGKAQTFIELKINFLRPLVGGTAVAAARLIHLGRRTGLAEADVTNDAGKLAAHCTATFMVVPAATAPGGRD